MEIGHFVPGQSTAPELPLAPYRSPTVTNALAPYFDAYTQPGDLILDLFCSRPTFIREAVQAGRRALGLNINPALLLAASMGLTGVQEQELMAAFTRLAQAPKGPQSLQKHVQAMYHTACLACGATVSADAFIWERDGDAPVAKRYRCPVCGDAPTDGVPTNEADRALATHFEARGLSYWLMLDRAAARDAPHRDRLAALLELYTPRNLIAVSDLLLKLDGLTITPGARQVLEALMLDTLDRASGLRSADVAPGWSTRPRRLQHPTRYVEANVWHVFEQALENWRTVAAPSVPLAPSLDALLDPNASTTTGGAAYLAPLSSGQARRQLPPGCAALILVDPPRPDIVMWQLSALWSAWLWGAEASAPLTSLLSRRWLDKEWLWRGLRGALASVAPLLRPDGWLVCLFSDENTIIFEALTLAAASAGYELIGWGVRPPEVQQTWRYAATPEPRPIELDALSRAVAERVVQASVRAVRLRGEPVAWPTLHAAIHTDLAQSGVLDGVARLPDEVADPLSWLDETVRSALQGAPLRQLANPTLQGASQTIDQLLWWVDSSLEPDAEIPLSDRVESAVSEILRDLLAVSERELERRVCARFPGPQTPSGHLVRLCLFSYGDEHAAGHWRLRAEDDLAARVAETDAVIADLCALGKRLGFDVRLGAPSAGEWAVSWLGETGHPVYAFAVRTTAVLGDLLFGSRSPDQTTTAGGQITTPCLVLPGGRAVLVGYKLRHDPRLRQQADQRGWQFLKFRHLRHLVQEVTAKQLDRYAFQAALGLDPIVEQEEAQMSLW